MCRFTFSIVGVGWGGEPQKWELLRDQRKHELMSHRPASEGATRTPTSSILQYLFPTTPVFFSVANLFLKNTLCCLKPLTLSQNEILPLFSSQLVGQL